MFSVLSHKKILHSVQLHQLIPRKTKGKNCGHWSCTSHSIVFLSVNFVLQKDGTIYFPHLGNIWLSEAVLPKVQVSHAASLWNVTSTIERESRWREVSSVTNIHPICGCRDFTGLHNYSACSLYFSSSFIELSSTLTLCVQGMDHNETDLGGGFHWISVLW